jgi:excisionase family DNA binding protein
MAGRLEEFDTDPFLNHREAAAKLSVHPGTIHRWIASGQLRHMRTPGNKIRIRKSDLDAFSEGQVEQK